ncbi:Large proline-rich protein BAG6 [Toxocara canis]|uniref:BCL2-associated athanogene 6 n=1 Tax=Toxocara canis TaxID=6265 RepID=A0A0B2VGB3_TOXCA|nr:Large proline-rich protein BAG6 [Toxocara canis]
MTYVRIAAGCKAPLSELRKLIEEHMNVPASRQRLIFQGHPLLVNERTLSEYGIADGLTLHMVERPADVVHSGGGGGGDTHGRRQGADSARAAQDGTNEQPSRAERARMNVINGEMTVARSALFQDADVALELVRGALRNTLSALSGNTSSEIELQEDAPRIGDLTLQVRIRGNALRHADSGARERLMRATEALERSERTMQLLDEGIVPYIDALERGDAELGENDAALVSLDECILQLEEVTTLPRAGNDAPSEAMETEESPRKPEQQPQTTAASDNLPDSDASSNASRVGTSQPSYVVEHSTGSDYTGVLQRLLDLQGTVNKHMMRYRDLLSSQTSLTNNDLTRYALIIYQEQVQRLLHRLAHVYHSLSDISVDLCSEAPYSNNLRPQDAHYDHSAGTEVVLSIAFLSPQAGRPGPQPSSRHELIAVTQSTSTPAQSAHELCEVVLSIAFLSPQAGRPGPQPSSRHELIAVTQSTSTPAQSAHELLRAMTSHIRNGSGQPSSTSTAAADAEHSTAISSGVPPSQHPTANTAASPVVEPVVAVGVAPSAPQMSRPLIQPYPGAPGYSRPPPALFTVANSTRVPHFLSSGFVPIPMQGAHFHLASGQSQGGAAAAPARTVSQQQYQNHQQQGQTQTTTDRNIRVPTSGTSTTATINQPSGNMDATAANAGFQQIVRNIFESTLGNVWHNFSSQPNTSEPDAGSRPANSSTLASASFGAVVGPTPSAAHASQMGAAPPMMHAFRAPFAPGIMGQVIVRTNGPANAEATRRAVDAAVHAANSVAANTTTAAANNVHVHANNGTPPRSPRNREAISWIRRAYANRASRATQEAEPPAGMFIGPSFPHDSPIYTTDPYLPCQSRFCNPRSIVRNSDDYENTISAVREAVGRYQNNLEADSPERQRADSIRARWNEVRGNDEADDHIAMNQRGEAVFERAEHFSSVIEVMMRRAVANMADTDSDVARQLHAASGEFDTFNYSITPIVNTPMRTIGLPMPVLGSIELESLSADIEIEPVDDMRRQQTMAMNVLQNLAAHNAAAEMATDTANLSQPAQSQPTQHTPQQGGEGDVDILEMVRALSNLMQSGRSVTLSQVMREMGQPVTRLESGFINLVLVMAYELLQVPELLRLFAGDFSAIYSNRQQIRRFIIENVFNDNSRPSEEDIENAAERVILAESALERFLSYDDVHRFVEVDGIGRVDLVESLLRVERRSIIDLLHAFLRRDEGVNSNEYSQRVVDIFADYVQRVVLIANLSMSGAPFDYETMLLRFMQDQPSGASDRQVVRWLSQMSVTHIRELLSRGAPFNVENMRDDFVVAPAQPDDATSKESDTPVNAVTRPERDEQMTSQQQTVDSEHSGGFESVSNGVVSADNGAPKEVEDTRWRMVLPEEWLPVIDGDRRLLASMASQAALSDAYLCGSPIARKKAKKVDTEGESGDDTMVRAVNAAFVQALKRAEQPVPQVCFFLVFLWVRILQKMLGRECVNSNEYSQRVVDIFADYVQRVVLIANLSMSGAPFDYETMLLRFMQDQPSGASDRQVVRWLSQMSVTHIRELLSRGAPFNVENMRDDFVVAPAQPDDATSKESDTPVNAVTRPERDEQMTSQQQTVDSEHSGGFESVSNGVVSADNGAPKEVEDTRWRMVLPEEWLPVIDGDRRLLASMASQAALSDAYLCGSPIARKKAKKVDTEGESGDDTMVRAVNAAFVQALKRAEQPVPQEVTRGDYRFELSNAAREEFDEAVAHRLQNDPDFEHEKFPELNKFYSNRRDPSS